MADNVDISLKLGTEADLSSAISAGARAGAAFAAAAQSAVKGISLTGGGRPSSAFSSVGGMQGVSSAELSKNFRSLGLNNALFSQIAVNAVKTSYGPAPINSISGISDLVKNKQAADAREWDDFVKEFKEAKKSLVHLDSYFTKPTPHATPIDLGFVGNNSWGSAWGLIKNTSMKGIAYAKLAEHFLAPFVEEALAVKSAEYAAHTARSAQGFRQEELNRQLAYLQRKHDVARMTQILAFGAAGASAGAAIGGTTLGTIGLILGSVGGPAGSVAVGAAGAKFGTIAGGTVGGIIGGGIGAVSSLWAHYKYKNEQNKLKAEYEQQGKSLDEALKRSQAQYLYGPGYNMSYQEAIGNMGIGISEEDIQTMSSNALTFRGRQAFGQVGIHEYTMLAQVPNYFAALEAGITNPETLHKLLAQDLANIGDPSYASYIASQLGGIGLGTYSALQNPAYAYATNSLNSRVLRGENARANRFIGGYVWKNAENAVVSTAASSAQNVMDAAAASESFYNEAAVTKPTATEVREAEHSFEDTREAVLKNNTVYAGNTYVIEVNVDGNNVETAKLTERDFVMGGMSYAVGGN